MAKCCTSTCADVHVAPSVGQDTVLLCAAPKKVLPDCTCEVWNEDDETPEHIISGCNLGKQFWEKLGATSMVGINVTNIH